MCMNLPKRLSASVFVIFLLAFPAFATDIYFGPTSAGSNNGTSCANAYAYNDATHGWSLSAQQVAGNNLHICTGSWPAFSSGATVFTAVNSGSSGSPITLIADQGTVVWQAPYFNNSGAIVLGPAYWTVNGDNNLTIENTLNGTPASYNGGATCIGGTCTQQQNSRLVYIKPCPNSTCNIEVKGLTLYNPYVHLPLSGDTVIGIGAAECIYLGLGNNNITIDNNKCRNAVDGIDGWGNNIDEHSNEIYYCDTCVAFGSSAPTSNFLFYANHIHDNYTWDETGDSYHHDGLHFYPINGGANVVGFIAYNNQFDGNFGTCCQTANFVLEASMTKPIMFNNVCLSQGGDYGMPCFDSFQNGTGGAAPNTVASPVFYNNSTHGIAYTCPEPCNNDIQAIDGYTTTLSEANNVLTGGAELVGIAPGSTVASGGIDYNLYENLVGAGASHNFNYGSNYYTTLAQWQAGTGQDAHAQIAAFSAMGLSSEMVPTSNSALTVGTGKNLYSVCNSQPIPGLGALCYDKPQTVGPGQPTLGPNARCSTGAWDSGAYTYTSCSSSGAQPSAPTDLTAIVQ